ncbi:MULTISPECIES: hypothetical protein [Methylorubrum]|uniref:Uncharacterized protein n=1 Tax=Methylorubrum populi TaxID=223967 RepID=A0A514KKN5_9HYPH|nr:hypothetical protein [Methylorubrum populi]KAB7787234.1 hypothetical protein F8B43_0670 [Methylorubrum populi]QDI79725.1 hypothetical protein E8E01_04425 [Methylorubrum populi]
MQQAQASREDRIRAAAAVIAQQTLTDRQLPLNGRLPHDVARALAERVVDAVIAADERVRRHASGPA